ncbi:hypothetical protein [Roseovarius sp. SYSU LYC5161]|jgi:outer membrane murein-binding lipoprotein Lpp|uniref:hypothetical protein n=1 Tax=Roseovarius halophilus (ex Wu et al. 2025) TaxID=3376060 RepID=UPI00399A4FDC
MKPILYLLPLVVLAACATPREACINEAQSKLRLLNAQIATAQGNIDRGYALAEVQDLRTVTRTCTGTNEDGSTFTFPCQKTRTYTREEPVAINVAEERAKLADLRQRRDAAAEAAEARIRQCIARHPE